MKTIMVAVCPVHVYSMGRPDGAGALFPWTRTGKDFDASSPPLGSICALPKRAMTSGAEGETCGGSPKGEKKKPCLPPPPQAALCQFPARLCCTNPRGGGMAEWRLPRAMVAPVLRDSPWPGMRVFQPRAEGPESTSEPPRDGA